MTISYGIGENYLKDWTIQEALREIYQNFMDYGSFTQKVVNINDNKFVKVTLVNTFKPTDFSFLKIGESDKNNNENAIGQHGEGLKMAFLVFLRLNYKLILKFNNYYITADWFEQELIGKSLILNIDKVENFNNIFTLEYIIPKNDFEFFNNNLIKKSDIIYSDSYHGDIVNKDVGNLYVGKLFVCNIKNFKKAYNLSPKVIKLDRDRRIPSAFETSYHTSKINESQAKISFVDQNFDDMKYVASIPKSQLKNIKPKIVGNSIEFVATENGKDIVITNSDIKSHLKQQTYFSKALNGIKRFLASKLGIDELLINFRNKYCNTEEAKKDFDIILERLGIDITKNNNNLPL
jgi:hypothetical protein